MSNIFTYNGIGQRVGKVDSTGTSTYTLTDDGIEAPVLNDGQASYQYALGIVSEVRSGVTKALHLDSLGSVRAKSSSSGSVTDSLETDAFGNAVRSTGSIGAFGFAGAWGYSSDKDTGLMRLGHRYYDSSTGRFISRDPIRDGYNWYVYCENDPVNSIDPSGLGLWDIDEVGKCILWWWGHGDGKPLIIDLGFLGNSGNYLMDNDGLRSDINEWIIDHIPSRPGIRHCA